MTVRRRGVVTMTVEATDAPARRSWCPSRSDRLLPWVLLAAALLVSPVDTSGQDRGLALLDGASERYGAVETVCADFIQHLQVPLLGSERTGIGRLCQGRPNLFAMRFSDPQGDLVVVDGESAWVYFPSNDPRTVLKTSAERAAGGQDFHREFLVEPEERYDVRYEEEDVVAGHRTYRLRLTPLRRSSYRSAIVWIDQGTPVLRQVRLEEENGNVRTITLDSVGFDVDPGDDWFRFSPPEGALVVER